MVNIWQNYDKNTKNISTIDTLWLTTLCNLSEKFAAATNTMLYGLRTAIDDTINRIYWSIDLVIVNQRNLAWQRMAWLKNRYVQRADEG